MMDDAEVKALLDGATPGPWRADGEPWNRVVWSSADNRICFMSHINGLNDERDVATSNLAAAAPDLARALLAARADAEAAVALALEEADLAVQAVSDNCETDGERLAIMAAVSAIRALAPASGVAKLEKLRAERDADKAHVLRLLPLATERDRLAAELAAANAREAGLADLLGRGAMYVSLSMREWHTAVAAALAQPSTEGEA